MINTTLTQHDLKIRPEYYTAITWGIKKFEIRYNDRNFKEGDILHLREWCENGYTGREVNAVVTYVLADNEFVKEGYVVMSIKVL